MIFGYLIPWVPKSRSGSPGGVQVMVGPNAPLDVAGKWWDSLTLAGTMAALWYRAQVSGFPGGRHRRDGGR